MNIIYRGVYFDIYATEDAVASLEVALNGVEARKRGKFKIKLRIAIEYLANNLPHDLTRNTYPAEGYFNTNKGVEIPLFAIKKIPVRAYFWRSKTHARRIVISHFIVKKWDDLDPADVRRAKRNFEALEVGE